MPTIIINAHKEDGAIKELTLNCKIAIASSIWRERSYVAVYRTEELKEKLEKVIEEYFEKNFSSDINYQKW